MAQALVDIFPDIGLDRNEFYRGNTMGRCKKKGEGKKERRRNNYNLLGFYTDIGNQRKFFENYAKQHGFDPLKPENWYTQPRKNIMSTTVLLSPPLLFNIFIYCNVGWITGSVQIQQQHAECAK
jgi:hypothetical protein